jgi:hypothetical protein
LWTADIADRCRTSILASPGRSPAQDAGVSGIPPGPANARGLNGSINDPSGIGNTGKVTPQPILRPVPVNQTVTESEIDGEMISGTKLVRYPSQ